MPSSATLNRAAHVLRRITPELPADAALRQELAANRRLSPGERRAVAHAVFAWCRWRQWLNLSEALQPQIAAALDWQARFDAHPATVKPEALALRAVPAWLAGEMALPPEFLRQLQRPPALWLRTRTGQTAAVARALGDCTPPAAPLPLPALAAPLATALRYTGTQDLYRAAPFQSGLFEIQDLASQLVGHACAPQPGETWWDACAGEGGKTLHLADQMKNKGLLWASDRSLRRLEALKKRTARAQVFNYRAAAWDGSARLPTKTKFDGILLDAPCSGIGTWQRNPHARWTTGPQDVRELAATQRALLDHVAPALKPGGRLLYAVCTLTRSETTDIAAAFTAAHPELEPIPVFPSTEATHFLWPHEWNANGMFLAAWRRKS
ncbi:MAG: RsmB/NOP family class I SAM-dependent RNA methyltransferase [Opitutae bacterium]|nr:RsmB/NOP family class I SAM-dependent RNA methyltransferase [Opitutae bacterium]